jgi:hypothetical protein
MATTTTTSTTSLETDTVCKWCEKEFRNERTLVAHMCPKKRRWADKDMTHVRLGFRVFQMFYELSTTASKTKSVEDFIRSQYYEAFVKFGRSCVRNEYLDPEKFAEWLIRNGKKLADWNKDSLYNEFLLEYVKKETGIRALERSVLYLAEWGKDNDCDWQDYFKIVSTPRAVHDIRAAKISPWLIYLSTTGPELLTRFSSEQVQMINDIIDAKFWVKVFARQAEEVTEVKSACEVAGI